MHPCTSNAISGRLIAAAHHRGRTASLAARSAHSSRSAHACTEEPHHAPASHRSLSGAERSDIGALATTLGATMLCTADRFEHTFSSGLADAFGLSQGVSGTITVSHDRRSRSLRFSDLGPMPGSPFVQGMPYFGTASTSCRSSYA